MKTDSIKQYLDLQEALKREKSELEARLARICKVLAGAPSGSPSPAPRAAGKKAKGKRSRVRNTMSLREAIHQVTRGKALTKQEILDEVLKLGYKFDTKKPIGSINSILYANPKFKNRNGRFSPPK